MKTINDVVTELQALETTEVEALQAAIAQAVTDLQAIAGEAPAAPTVESVAVTFTDGSTQTVPAPASA